MSDRYVFIFDYESDWMILCYENGRNKKYFNSSEDDWDNSLEYAELFIENGGNEYYYKLPSYDLIDDMDVFELKNEQIKELSGFLR